MLIRRMPPALAGRGLSILSVLSSMLLIGLGGSPARAAGIDPRAVEIQSPQGIKWERSADGGSERALLFGDPSKPGPYVMRIKWLPGNHFSKPHFHDADRFFVVISGTWWVGTGNQFDIDSTVPATAGSYVIHHGGQIHFDGAKNEEAVIQVWGVGPVSTTPAASR